MAEDNLMVSRSPPGGATVPDARYPQRIAPLWGQGRQYHITTLTSVEVWPHHLQHFGGNSALNVFIHLL